MRTVSFPNAIAGLLLLSACIGDLLTVHIEEQGSTVVDGAGLVGEVLSTLSFGGFDDLSVTIDQELANQGVEPGDIASVYVVQLTLSTPDADDLSFLESLDIYASSPDLDRVRIAHLDSFPTGQASLDMELDGEDLTAFVVADGMTITTEASGTLPEDDTTIDVYMAIDVQATAQGACAAASR